MTFFIYSPSILFASLLLSCSIVFLKPFFFSPLSLPLRACVSFCPFLPSSSLSLLHYSCLHASHPLCFLIMLPFLPLSVPSSNPFVMPLLVPASITIPFAPFLSLSLIHWRSIALSSFYFPLIPLHTASHPHPTPFRELYIPFPIFISPLSAPFLSSLSIPVPFHIFDSSVPSF